MKRLHWFHIMLVAVAASLLPTLPANAQAPSRPNIIVVIADDLDSVAFNEALRMGWLPNIDKWMVQHGTTFNNMFVTQSLCCPSRATFHTGQYPQNSLVTDNSQYKSFRLEREKKALATWLSADYYTGHFGKYMNGWTLEEGGGDKKDNYGYWPPGWNTWRGLVAAGGLYESQCMYGYALSTGGDPLPKVFGAWNDESDETLYQTNKLATLATNWIVKPDTKRPFFLVVTPTAPHVEGCDFDAKELGTRIRTTREFRGTASRLPLPAAALKSFNEKVIKDKPLWMQKDLKDREVNLGPQEDLFNQKIGALRSIDLMVGKIFDTLSSDAVKQLHNTVVIFTSDNGYQYGTHRLTGKQDFYEESIAVPMVVRAPDSPATAQSSDEWVLNNDWAATIADYANVTPKLDVDGRTFRSIITGNGLDGPRKSFMVRFGDPLKGVTNKCDVNNPPSPPSPTPGSQAVVPEDSEDHYPFLMLRTRDPVLTGDPNGKLVMVYAETYKNLRCDGIELYDLDADEIQVSSLHLDARHKTRMEAMQKHLHNLAKCKGESCRSLEKNVPTQ